MNTNNTHILTDDLERQLMMQAIEQQFRPRPLRALRNAFRLFINAFSLVARRMAAARVNNFQTQAL